MMPILVKPDDVRSGRKAKARHGRPGYVRQRSQRVNAKYTKTHQRVQALILIWHFQATMISDNLTGLGGAQKPPNFTILKLIPSLYINETKQRNICTRLNLYLSYVVLLFFFFF